MRFIDLAEASATSIRGHPLRSALTALGAVIGVAALTILLAIGVGAQRQIQAAIQLLGPDVITVTPTFRPAENGLGFSLRDRDVIALREHLDGAQGVAGTVQTQEELSAGERKWSASLNGVDGGYFQIRYAELSSGRLPYQDEIDRNRRVAVIGSSVAAALFPNTRPVGSDLRVGRTHYQVVGVLRARGNTLSGSDADNVVIIPLRLARLRLSAGDSLQQIYVKAGDEKSVEDLSAKIRELLRAAHRLRPNEDDDFQVSKSTAMLDAARATNETLSTMLALLGIVSLTVGGIGIMNIMLVSVAERRREIALRMAVGATRGDIANQFLCEAVCLSLGGGLLGIVVGIAGVFIINASGWNAAVSAWIPALAIVVSVATGATFGAYPAWQAGRFFPMDSLRGL